jgi:hypothetical protein
MLKKIEGKKKRDSALQDEVPFLWGRGVIHGLM